MNVSSGHPSSEVLRTWHSRQQMVEHALSASMLWFGCTNAGFALLVAMRNLLFNGFDQQFVAAEHWQRAIALAMTAVIILSLGLMILALLLRRAALPRASTIIAAIALALGLLWAGSSYLFVAGWQVPAAWPLMSILLFTGVVALYFFPAGLWLFTLPLWLALLLASLQLNQGMNPHFAAVWLVFTLLLLSSRVILQHWFNEAWLRQQQNQRLIAQLETLASQDALTGTANRRALEWHLAAAVQQQLPLAAMMLDVDYFKRYNDRYGHQAGDICLATVASVLKPAVRSPQDIVARYGGEEFFIMLAGASADEAQQVAARIQTRLQQAEIAHAASEVSHRVTVSIGITASDGSRSAEEVIAAADAALYRAKQQGRNRWSG